MPEEANSRSAAESKTEQSNDTLLNNFLPNQVKIIHFKETVVYLHAKKSCCHFYSALHYEGQRERAL